MRTHKLFIIIISFSFLFLFGFNDLSKDLIFWKTLNETQNITTNDQSNDPLDHVSIAKVQSEPTKTPRPTITPPTIPPPQNEAQTNMMILFMALAVMVVILGLWLNRERKRD